MTDDLDLDVIEEMMQEQEMEQAEKPASSEQAHPARSRFSGWSNRFKKNVPDNITEDKPADSVPSFAVEPTSIDPVPAPESDGLLECEACDRREKTLHKLKNMKLCKTCYEKELELPPIVPGDSSQPQNVVEQIIEADRRFGRKVIDNAIVKETEKALNSEKLLTEDMLDGSMDPARFKEVFMNVINQECIGKNLVEIEESIRRDHEMLFDKRAGIQAKLSFRQELLKSESAETRAKALKEDWLVKPLRAKAEKSKAKSVAAPKAKVDPIESMRRSLLSQGMSPEKVEKKIKAFQGLD